MAEAMEKWGGFTYERGPLTKPSKEIQYGTAQIFQVQLRGAVLLADRESDSGVQTNSVYGLESSLSIDINCKAGCCAEWNPTSQNHRFARAYWLVVIIPID